MMPCLPNCGVPAEKERVNCWKGLFVIGLLMQEPNAIVGSALHLLVAQLVFLFTNKQKRVNVDNVEKGSLAPT
jgi:hypothetical protein